MSGAVYKTGRMLQVLALLLMPSAIWAAQIKRSERASVSLFCISIVIFALGYVLTQISKSV